MMRSRCIDATAVATAVVGCGLILVPSPFVGYYRTVWYVMYMVHVILVGRVSSSVLLGCCRWALLATAAIVSNTDDRHHNK